MKNETKTKMVLFEEDFSDQKKFESKLENLFQYIFLNIFPNILNLPRLDFMNSLMTSVKSILEEQYTNEIYSNEKFFSLFLSTNKIFEKKYKDYNQILSNAWDNYPNDINNNNNIYFTEFKKHCGKTQEHAMHLCNKNENGKYILVYLKKEIKFIICEKCRKAFYANLFVNFCQNCNCNYYSGLISQNEYNNNIQLATYSNPHCDSIVNEKIPCIKCKEPLYYNIKDNIIECLNSKCKYKIRLFNNSNWKCNICSNYFKSDIKFYNYFDLLYIKRIYGIALIIKQKAHPGILPCCQNLDEKNLIFNHKKECKGILYFWILNKKIIVICEKCKAINYFNRFIWTCPNCGLHFKAKKEEIEEKIKKNLINNLKMKFNIHVILGDEFLLDNLDNNINNGNIYDTVNNDCHKLTRKRSFRELLEQKKKGYSIERTISKEIKDEPTLSNTKREKKKFIPRNSNDNINYNMNSKGKVTIEEEAKPSIKKRKNYLFDKLLRNQFVSQKNIYDSNKKNQFKRTNSGAIYFTDKKNKLEEQKENKNDNINYSGNKFRLRAKSGYIKNDFGEFLKNDKYQSENKNENKNEINSIFVDDKFDKKKEKNRKNMPPLPLPFRIKHKLNNNYIYNNQEKLKLYFEFLYEKQNNYKTLRMIVNNKNNDEKTNKNIKRNLSDKAINKLTIEFFDTYVKNNIKRNKNEKSKDKKIIRRLEYKFNEDYNQKKTKNKTDSDEEKSDIDEKILNKDENVEIIIKNKNNKKNIGFYNIRESKLKQDNSSNDKNNKNNNNENITITQEEKKQRNFPLYKRFKEKDSEDNIKKVNINSRPSDIINTSMLDTQMENIIENDIIKKDKELFNSIQTKIKKILSKGKLPIFNIDNYKIEKQIGEGSFGHIYQVMNKKNYIKYAMKKIIANNLTSLETFQTEFEIVHQNNHQNILDILGICIRCLDQTTFVLYVLMDLALYDWDFEIESRKKQKKYYTEKELISILKQISSALVYLQKVKRIAHRDIKPENILVFNDGVYKLGDFGEAKITRLRRNNARSTIRGTEMYMSPALFKALQDNKDDIKHDIYKSDVFSLGYCFVFAAVLDFKILEDIRILNNDFKVKKILQRILFLRYSKEFIELLFKMICVNEEDRIDFIGLEKLLQEKKF